MSAHALESTGLAGDTASRVHALDPRAKLIAFTGLTLVVVTAPLSAWPVYLVAAAVLAAAAALARVPARVIGRRARVILPVVLAAAFIPFVRDDGLAVFAAVTIKAALGTASAVLLGATTTYPDVLRALEALRVPRIFTLIAAFMYRYLFVLVGELRRMRSALAARGYRPRSALGAGAAGRVATAMFLRTYGRGERVYLAMLARGYRGSVPRIAPLSFARVDAAFVAFVLAAPLVARGLTIGGVA
jgi:cobalt/nickel transport system permease protein